MKQPELFTECTITVACRIGMIFSLLVVTMVCTPPAGAWDFADDFSGGVKWEFGKDSIWSVKEGVLSANVSKGVDVQALAKAEPAADVLIETDVRFSADSQRHNFGFVLRSQGDQRLVLRYYDGPEALELLWFHGSGWSPVGNRSPKIKLSPGNWYTLKAAAVGQDVAAKLWPSGQAEPDWQLRVRVNARGSGRVGLVVHDAGRFDFRKFRFSTEVPTLGVTQRQVYTALSPNENQDILANLFSMDGLDIITAPENLAVNNGKMSVGTPGDILARIDGLWAPPYVSSDFALGVEVFGKSVSTPAFKWWPYKLEQRGEANGVELTSAVVLMPGRRGGLVALTLHNPMTKTIDVPLSMNIRGTLDYRGSWEFGQAVSSTATQPAAIKSTLTLTAGERSIILQGTGDALTWNAEKKVGMQSLVLEPGGTATAYLAFAMGPSGQAAAACNAIAADPAKALADADADHKRQIETLFQRIPRLVSDNKDLDKFYNRSLVHFITNRWDVPEFLLHPNYTTGSTRGGCVCNYLWNYGEIPEIMPLYDPAAHREHIRHFLECDMTVHFSFNPVDGKAFGPWYMVNQEKIIGMVYHYVKITGNKAFLEELVDGKTVLEHVIKNAVVLDDISKPVALIDYGPSNSHLELRRAANGYNHVMPDLNGRRYSNYLLAAHLAEITGKPAPYLRQRAAALKTLLKQKLWNPGTQWFDFINDKGQPETRWTMQMFYLLGSGVLDNETETGLISHLNDKEFLSEYGLHSLAKGDPLYDPADVDNGGPGACTSFPPNIAKLLDMAGRPREAENIIRRCVWWGNAMPYWGDSIVAERIDYRRDTPLQCTIDAVSVAQYFIFGLFGVDPQFDGSILVSPRPNTLSSQIALRGVRIRDMVFDLEVGDNQFKVISGEKSLVAPMGRTVSLNKDNGGIAIQFLDGNPKGSAK